MPSAYAHLRFGRNAVSAFPRETARLTQRFPQLYQMGLQGPDFLFYYNPFMNTATGDLARYFHKQSGREFFGNAVNALNQAPSEGARAYLLGLLGHYALDSVCHPFVKSVAKEGKIGHMELETEFDRFLLERDGMVPPCTQKIHRYLRLTRGECVTAAQFFPDVTPAAVNSSVHHMAWIHWLLSVKRRKMVERLMALGGKTGQEMVMPQTPNENCCHLNGKMLELYHTALDSYPGLAAQLFAAPDGSELSDDFAVSFG